MTLDPARHTFTIWKSATFHKQITLLTGGAGTTPRDLTGYTAVLDIRANPTDSVPLLSLSTTNGGIVLGGVAGTIDILISSTISAGLTWSAATYHLFITAPVGVGGETDPVLYGAFKVSTI